VINAPTTLPTRRARATSLVLAAVVAALVLAPAVPAGAAARRAPAHGYADRWASGAYVGAGDGRPAAEAFGRYRHRPLDVASTYLLSSSWDDIAQYTYMADAYRGFRGTLSIAVPMVPRDGRATLADVLTGAHDDAFRSLGRNLAARGRGDSYLRLGWEFNGDWFPWAAKDPTLYKAAFRREALLLRSVAPRLRIEWDGNIGYSQVRHDPFTELYPGDDVVDVVGMDGYDVSWYHVRDELSWRRYRTSEGGLARWLGFAQQHHKRFAVPEWGLNVSGGGDNPYYINKMHQFFAASARSLAYESYFSTATADTRSSLTRPVLNPRSSRLYAQLWGRRR